MFSISVVRVYFWHAWSLECVDAGRFRASASASHADIVSSLCHLVQCQSARAEAGKYIAFHNDVSGQFSIPSHSSWGSPEGICPPVVSRVLTAAFSHIGNMSIL